MVCLQWSHDPCVFPPSPLEVLRDRESAERVAGVIEVPALAGLVHQAAPRVLAAQQQVLLQSLLVEQPTVIRERGALS